MTTKCRSTDCTKDISILRHSRPIVYVFRTMLPSPSPSMYIARGLVPPASCYQNLENAKKRAAIVDATQQEILRHRVLQQAREAFMEKHAIEEQQQHQVQLFSFLQLFLVSYAQHVSASYPQTTGSNLRILCSEI